MVLKHITPPVLGQYERGNEVFTDDLEDIQTFDFVISLRNQ